ncbi:CAAX amino terminal protease family protein [Candidatus Rhodobacter oscarellae]|uniref:CAAX amino terminal protease family protein n=1 Tax=Candidatus Rhodobacter oscarellae TaxID=1675527 RepID=A0A0J9H022_9RHOB|nr:type II CAAX endopeptidase family protein [Candidatus Rhodobacter lobularis]KMW59098.1 CAAX amino terminal protease family protein [Candidatus Rhodobacter lobularis]
MSERFPDPFESFVAPARARPEVWRMIVGLFLIAAVVMGAGMMLSGVLSGVTQGPWDEVQASTRYSLFVLYFFATIFLALWVGLPLLHERGFATLFGDPGLAVRQFFACLLPLFVVTLVVYAAPPWGGYGGVRFNLGVLPWLLLLPISALGVLIQVTAEEVLFRGYLVQQMAVRSMARVSWFLVPGLLFGLLHYDPEVYGASAWMIAGWAMLFSFAAADLTYRSGTLGPAIALHFVNNCVAILIFSFEGPLSGLSLFIFPETLEQAVSDPGIFVVDAMVMLIGWLTCRIALRC